MDPFPSHSSQNDEESFIILGNSSPETSLEMALVEAKILQCSKGSDLFNISTTSDNKSSESTPVKTAFQAQFNLNQPESETIEKANAIIKECSNDSDLQTKILQLLEKNSVLGKALEENSLSMREQFKSMADWDVNMIKMHQLHETKINEARRLIEKLQRENFQLRKDLDLQANLQPISSTSRDSDMSDTLTARLEDEELCRKIMMKDYEKLVGEKKMLKTQLKKTQEKYDSAIKFETVNIQLLDELNALKQERASQLHLEDQTNSRRSLDSVEESFVVTGSQQTYSDLENTVKVLTSQLEVLDGNHQQVQDENEKLVLKNKSLENELSQMMKQIEDLKMTVNNMEQEKERNQAQDLSLENKIFTLQDTLNRTQVKLFESENEKIDLVQREREFKDEINHLTTGTATLKERLKEAHTIIFQPVRYSLSLEAQCDNLEFANFVHNVKLYDSTLKELASYLNHHSHQYWTMLDSVTKPLKELQLEGDGLAPMQQKLAVINSTLEGHHIENANCKYQVKAALSTFEQIFLDYQQTLKIVKDEERKNSEYSKLREEFKVLTDRLREVTVENAGLKETIVKKLREEDHFQLQLSAYKSDFDAERNDKKRITSEIDQILTNFIDFKQKLVELSRIIPVKVSPEKMITLHGRVSPKAKRFHVNLMRASSDDVVFHASFRFTPESCVVRNHYTGGVWGTEERRGGNPLRPSMSFRIDIRVGVSYQMFVNGNYFCEFIHRLDYRNVSHIEVKGDVVLTSVDEDHSGSL